MSPWPRSIIRICGNGRQSQPSQFQGAVRTPPKCWRQWSAMRPHFWARTWWRSPWIGCSDWSYTMDPRRAQRVAETLREELSEMIAYELDDPRVLAVDVTEVQVAPDMKKAVVRVSLHGDAEERGEALKALEHARHFLRRQISK